ncbi:MAG: hypothetical protein KDE27_00935 [Planctomycetes bacterium]|nr:hypothetical protein [Planctomycetota bacterium]
MSNPRTLVLRSTLAATLLALADMAAAQTIVADIHPTGSSNPAGYTRVGDLVCFVADDGVHGRELWASDGTAAGTALVLDIQAGSGSSNIWNLTVLDGVLFFTARQSGFGTELWRSDGTAAGTTMVADINPGNGNSGINSIARAGDRLFFFADDGVHGKEPWSSDGTAAGTAMLADLRAGSSTSNPQFLSGCHGACLFGADDGVVGRELWISDGTPAGTRLLKDIEPNGWTSTFNFTVFRDEIFFLASSQNSGATIWKTEGTTAGTQLVLDLDPAHTFGGELSFEPMVVFDDKLWFFGDDGVVGEELWRTDGTAAGTELVVDAEPGASGSSPATLTVVGDRLHWITQRGSGVELWVADRSGNIGSLGQIQPYFQMDGYGITAAGSELFFLGDDGVTGPILWHSDGTIAGTGPLSSIAATTAMAACGGRFWLTAYDPTAGAEPFVLDTAIVEHLGQACAPLGALAPTIGHAGTPQLGRDLFTTLADTAPGSLGIWIAGGGSGPQQLPNGGACRSWVDPVLASVVIATDGAGRADNRVAVPADSSWLGVELTFQYVVLQSGGPAEGFAVLSAGLAATIGS